MIQLFVSQNMLFRFDDNFPMFSSGSFSSDRKLDIYHIILPAEKDAEVRVKLSNRNLHPNPVVNLAQLTKNIIQTMLEKNSITVCSRTFKPR
jgi:hypothetical protein